MTTEDLLGLAKKAKTNAETDFNNGLKDKKGWAEYTSAQHHLFYEMISREY
jgi:hypothetical protein